MAGCHGEGTELVQGRGDVMTWVLGMLGGVLSVCKALIFWCECQIVEYFGVIKKIFANRDIMKLGAPLCDVLRKEGL